MLRRRSSKTAVAYGSGSSRTLNVVSSTPAERESHPVSVTGQGIGSPLYSQRIGAPMVGPPRASVTQEKKLGISLQVNVPVPESPNPYVRWSVSIPGSPVAVKRAAAKPSTAASTVSSPGVNPTAHHVRTVPLARVVEAGRSRCPPPVRTLQRASAG